MCQLQTLLEERFPNNLVKETVITSSWFFEIGYHYPGSRDFPCWRLLTSRFGQIGRSLPLPWVGRS